MRLIEKDGTLLTVYQPNERQGGLIWAVRQAIHEISISREVIIRLFLRDFTSQFRQKIFSYLWALLTPLLGIASFIFMYFMGILNPGVKDVPYPVYILLGTSIWGCMTGAMASVSNGLQAQSDLVMRTNIPKFALATSGLAGVVYSIFIGMVTMGIVFFLFDFAPTWWYAIYPIMVLPMLVLGIAFGLVLSVIGSIARDFTPIVSQGLGLLMYATPVAYLADNVDSPLAKMAIKWNPLTYLIEAPRDLIFKGDPKDIGIYFIVTLGCLICLAIALRIFYLIQDLVAERL